MGTIKHVSIQQALQNVADHPELHTDELVQVRVSELIARSLYEIALTGDANVRGSLTRANKAHRMILDRLVGKRRAGTHPASKTVTPLEFVDLTLAPQLEEAEDEAQPE